MATRSSPYFNSPQFAQLANNLSSMFAPPDSADLVNYAQASGLRDKNSRLSDLWKQAEGFDQRGVAAGLYNPTQSYYAVDRNNATDLAKSLATNNLKHGEAMPGLPAELAAALGVPEVAPVTGAQLGAPQAPMSSDEVLAQAMLGQMDRDPNFGSDLAQNELDVVKIIGADGETPRYAPEGRAGALGLEAFVDPGSQPKKNFVTYKTPDGRTGTAVQDPATGQMFDQSTSEPLPQGTITGSIEDTAEGLTTSATSSAQKAIMEIDNALTTAYRLQELSASAPGTGGLVGSIRGTLQDLVQTGGEVSQLMSNLQISAQRDLETGRYTPEAAEMIQAVGFDPNIPARQALVTLLAAQYAKTLSPDRVSNEMIGRIRQSLGGDGMLSNQASMDAALGEMIRGMEAQRGQYSRYSDPGVAPPAPSRAAPQAPAATAAPAVGTVEEGYEFTGGDPADPNNWRPVQ